MRLRNIPRAESTIEAHDVVINQPEAERGKWAKVFGNSKPIHIEIGMGKGQFLLNMALAHPDAISRTARRPASSSTRSTTAGRSPASPPATPCWT